MQIILSLLLSIATIVGGVSIDSPQGLSIKKRQEEGFYERGTCRYVSSHAWYEFYNPVA